MTATISGRAIGNAVATTGNVGARALNVVVAFVYANICAAVFVQAPPSKVAAQVPASICCPNRGHL